MKSGLFTGSFDPITLGHIDIIRRASNIFDCLYIVLFNNTEKHYLFSKEIRLKMLEASCKTNINPNCKIIIDNSDALVADYVKDHNISAVVRGVRNSTDLDYEKMIDQVGKKINSDYDTILLCSNPQFEHISSSVVRDMIKYNRNLEDYIPKEALEIIQEQ